MRHLRSAYTLAGTTTAGGAVSCPAAEDDLHDLVDDEQGDGHADAEQPLVTAERGQAQAPLQEAQLGRQVDEQQGQTVEQSPGFDRAGYSG